MLGCHLLFRQVQKIKINQIAGLTISKADLPRERDEINRFITKHFFTTPIVEAFGLEKEKPPPIPDCAGFVLMAVDNKGQLAGVAFNTTKPTNVWRKGHSDKETKIVEFFEFIIKESKLEEMPQNTIEAWLGAVHPAWRRQGVCHKITEESLREAKRCGFGAMTMICIGDHVWSMARSLGYSELYRLSCKDYQALSGKDLCLDPKWNNLNVIVCVNYLCEDGNNSYLIS